MPVIPKFGYLLVHGQTGRELYFGTPLITCFGDASNVGVDEARAINRDVHIVALSLRASDRQITERRKDRKWQRIARVITTDMVRLRRTKEGVL